MIYEVVISKQAEADLRNIYEYIAFELLAPENAAGQLNRIEKCIMQLEEMPERFRKYEKEPWKSRGLHIVPVDNYCILYISNSDTKEVTIIRVMYSGREMERLLNQFTKI